MYLSQNFDYFLLFWLIREEFKLKLILIHILYIYDFQYLFPLIPNYYSRHNLFLRDRNRIKIAFYRLKRKIAFYFNTKTVINGMQFCLS